MKPGSFSTYLFYVHSQDPGDTEIGSSRDFKLNVNLVWKDVENVEQ